MVEKSDGIPILDLLVSRIAHESQVSGNFLPSRFSKFGCCIFFLRLKLFFSLVILACCCLTGFVLHSSGPEL